MRNKTILSIVVPVYNEEKTVKAVLNNLVSVPLPKGIDKEILVVDDCSKDQSRDLINESIVEHPNCNIQLHAHSVNKGKGAAIRTGINQATGQVITIQDADLEYDPNELIELLMPILDNKADVVYGSRFRGSRPHRILFFWHSIGNKFLTFLSNMMTNLNLTDMETCYKMFRSEVLKSIELKEDRFGFEPEVTAKISRIPGIRIYEVGISYYGRTFEEGKKIGWRDGLQAIYCIIKYNLKN